MDELLVWRKFSWLDFVEDIRILSCGIVDIGIEVRHWKDSSLGLVDKHWLIRSFIKEEDLKSVLSWMSHLVVLVFEEIMHY